MSRYSQNRGKNTTHGVISSLYQRINELTESITALTALVSANIVTSNEKVGYKGSWNASVNTPTLGNNGAGGTKGDYYDVIVSGTTSIDGEATWVVGDFIIHNGKIWQKIANSGGGGGGSVTSVNGHVGDVVLTPTDIGLGNVNDESKESVLENSVLTGTTNVENIIEAVQSYTGAGNAYDISTDGQYNNVINNVTPSVITLPLNPENGSTYRIINYGTSTIDITPIAPNKIENLEPGAPLTLFNYLDKVTLLYIGNVWNLI